MKNLKTIQITAIFLLIIGTALKSSAQKKVHSFTEERKMQITADMAWTIIGEEFADVSSYHSGIVNSELINGSLKSEVGCERVCTLDENGEKYVKEKITDYNSNNKTLTIQVFSTVGVPTLPEYTFVTYKIEAIDSKSCRVIVTQTYRTKPAFLGSLTKGKFKKVTKEHLAFIEHYAMTGEEITKENQKTIKKQYDL